MQRGGIASEVRSDVEVITVNGDALFVLRGVLELPSSNGGEDADCDEEGGAQIVCKCMGGGAVVLDQWCRCVCGSRRRFQDSIPYIELLRALESRVQRAA